MPKRMPEFADYVVAINSKIGESHVWKGTRYKQALKAGWLQYRISRATSPEDAIAQAKMLHATPREHRSHGDSQAGWNAQEGRAQEVCQVET